MTLATLQLHIDVSGIIEELKDVCEVAAYEVHLGDGNVVLYSATETDAVEQLSSYANVTVEPLYKFKKSQPDPNQPGLFEESQSQ